MGIGSDRGGPGSNKLGLVGNALSSGVTRGGGAQPAAVPTMDSSSKVNDPPNPSISSIASSLEQLLEVAHKIAASESIRQNVLLNNLISTNRTALENLRESSPATSSANSPLTNLMPLNELIKKFELLSNVLDDKINESNSADDGNTLTSRFMEAMGWGGNKPKAGGTVGAGSRAGTLGKFVKGAGAVAAVGLGAIQAYSGISEASTLEGQGQITSQEASKRKSMAAGEGIGTVVGTGAGAILGAPLGPVGSLAVGTVGAVVGGKLGSMGGEFASGLMGDSVERPPVKQIKGPPSTPTAFGSPEYLTGKEPSLTAKSMAPQVTTGTSIMTATEQNNAPMISPSSNMLGYDPGQNMFKPQRSITTSTGRVGIGNVPTPDYSPSGKNNLGEMFQLMFFNLNYQEQ